MADDATDAFDLDGARARLASGEALSFEGVTLTHSEIMGKRMTFCTDMIRDPVQRNHRLGQFYAMGDLQALQANFPTGGVFADFGANVGNHSLFAAIYMGASSVIPVEPNLLAYRLLMANIAVNGVTSQFDLTHLGKGVGATAISGFGMEPRARNLGAAKMLAGEGELSIEPGDAILADVTPDMIKVDVEAMEMDVLAGLEETVRRCHPVLFVEVDQENDAVFKEWAKSHDYEAALEGRQYVHAKNYLLRPISA